MRVFEEREEKSKKYIGELEGEVERVKREKEREKEERVKRRE